MSHEGIDQAKKLGELLAGERLEAVYSSPRIRAHRTAEQIAEKHGLSVAVDETLDEIDFGAWTGRPFRELDKDPDWHRWNERRGEAAPPGGETMVAAADRMSAALGRLTARHGGAVIAAVSHCDTIRGGVARLLGLPLDNILRFEIDPASVSRILFGAWGSRLLTLNERPCP